MFVGAARVFSHLHFVFLGESVCNPNCGNCEERSKFLYFNLVESCCSSLLSSELVTSDFTLGNLSFTCDKTPTEYPVYSLLNYRKNPCTVFSRTLLFGCRGRRR